jgi:hydrogenase expression/formation protein HypC
MCLAIPGQIVEVVPGVESWAIVDVVGIRRRVDISLVTDEGAAPGDWVLIHVGFAMSKISEEAAAEQMELLHMLGETASALEEAGGYGSAGHPPDIWPGSAPGS